MDIFKRIGFRSFFGALFLGAFNDNLFRTALVTLVTYGLTQFTDTQKALMVTGAIGLFMLPFFLFSALAGQIADKVDKAKLVRIIKAAEVIIALFIAAGFVLKSPEFLLLVLFFMGAQSAFFGPLKYSIIPELLPKSQLIAGNGWTEAGTFVSILLGTVFGALLIAAGPFGTWLIAGIVIVIAILGYGFSRLIPKQKPANPNLRINYNLVREIVDIVNMARQDQRVFRAIMGIAWFWLIGATFMSQLPGFANFYLMVDESVFTLLLTIFTIGIGSGSLYCNHLLKAEVTSKYVPLTAFLIMPFLMDIAFAGHPLAEPTFFYFLSTWQGWRILIDLFALCFLGGLYIVPLYALIQVRTHIQQRAQIFAANNIINAGAMVIASGAAAALLSMGIPVPTLFLLLGIGQIVVTLYIFRILPDDTMRWFLRVLLKFFFRLEVEGLENYKKAGKRVMLIANHTSFLDALIITAVLPEKPLFAINTHMAQKWWLRPILVLVDIFPMDPTNPMALRGLIDEARKDQKILIFPEGRLTTTGSLMKVYQGPGMVADKAECTVLPICLQGADKTYFSRAKAIRKLFPRIRMTILPPEKIKVSEDLMGRQRREAQGRALYNIMADMVFETYYRKKILFKSLIEATQLYGRRHIISEDVKRKPMSYGQLLLKSFTLGNYFKSIPNPNLGLLLPNTHAMTISFWACQSSGKIPALLNFSTGLKNAVSCCRTASLTHVVTARQFVEKGKLEDMIAAFEKEGIELIYLEDLKREISLRDKALGLLGYIWPHRALRILNPDQIPSERSVILFTSGSEGVPKGVILSHLNLQANRAQLDAVVDFNANDIVFNALPLFHSFGLSAGMILPMLTGIRTFFYVSPLHYRVVAELVYDTNATVLFGTDTFLNGYARVAHAYDFHCLRYVFAGAEKLKPMTREQWSEKFGARIFEGYGATETSPVLAVNTPMDNKSGTVGHFLPGIEYRLETIPGIEKGGRLFVKGPNIMLGYLFADNPGKVVPPEKGWYDTGDIVSVDEEGRIRIEGRAKRFAKIAGEMISLTAVEEFITRLHPNNINAIMARPDPRKGEQLILYTNAKDITRPDLAKAAKLEGLSELFIPRDIVTLDKMPLLGTGKVDYMALKG